MPDKAGYFVIIPRPQKGLISAEHDAYDNMLLYVIEGPSAGPSSQSSFTTAGYQS